MLWTSKAGKISENESSCHPSFLRALATHVPPLQFVFGSLPAAACSLCSLPHHHNSSCQPVSREMVPSILAVLITYSGSFRLLHYTAVYWATVLICSLVTQWPAPSSGENSVSQNTSSYCCLEIVTVNEPVSKSRMNWLKFKDKCLSPPYHPPASIDVQIIDHPSSPHIVAIWKNTDKLLLWFKQISSLNVLEVKI